jgi:hypothetical protein
MSYDAIFFTDITDSIGGALPPIGSYKCAHVLRKNGYRCLVVRMVSWYEMDELKHLMDQVLTDCTKLIGFSTTFLRQKIFDPDKGYQYEPLNNDRVFSQGKDFENKFIDYCRKLNPKIKFLAGGSRASEGWQNRNMDYAFIGFSEVAMVNLMDHLAKNTELKYNKKNIWGVTIMDDRLASSYDFTHDRMEWLPEDVVNAKSLPIEIGRGCIFRCKFCSYPMNGKKTLDFVKLPDLLCHELEENFAKYGIRDYMIVDDTFNDHVEKLKALADMAQKLPFQPRFWGYHRLDLICTHPETLPMLNDIGVRALFFGIETLNQQTGRIIGKGFDRRRQIDMIQHIRKTYPDMSLHGSFIAGLPHESLTSMELTYRMLQNQEVPLHSWMINGMRINLQTQFKSEIEQNWEKYGYKDLGKDNKLGGKISPLLINWINEHTTFEHVLNLAREVMLESAGNPAMHVTGQLSMQIGAIGADGFDFKTNANTIYQNLDFHKVENNFFLHVQEYKQKLLDRVKQTNIL